MIEIDYAISDKKTEKAELLATEVLLEMRAPFQSAIRQACEETADAVTHIIGNGRRDGKSDKDIIEMIQSFCFSLTQEDFFEESIRKGAAVRVEDGKLINLAK